MFVHGSRFGKYTIRRKLGQGGFGAVFAAYDESLDRDVALKLLNAEHTTSADVVRRFIQEARLAARIGHPGIVTVFECAEITIEDRGIAYIAMELLDGETLTSRLARSGSLSTPIAMEIGRQIACALEAAHRGGIVHRDLKPDNVFLVRDPAVLHGERVKVLDFGIAKLGHSPSSARTATNEVFGTPIYMSPEQCRSSTQIDLRSDIYTLGCILFELLAGRPPFEGAPGELFAKHLMVEAPSVRQYAKDTPEPVAALIAKMLAKEPAARPQTMGDVQRGLEAGGAVIVGTPATLPPGDNHAGWAPTIDNYSTLKAAAGMSMMHEPPVSRRSRAIGIAGAVAVAVVVAIAFVGWVRSSGDELVATAPPPQPVATAPRNGDEAAPKSEAKAPKSEPAPESQPDKPTPKTAKTKASKIEKPEPAKASKIEKAEPAKATVATGTLSLMSSPPCVILVDGKAIAASTPSDIKLSPGKHRITLVHDEYDIKESFIVEIAANTVHRVMRDLHDKIKTKKRNQTINPFGGG